MTRTIKFNGTIREARSFCEIIGCVYPSDSYESYYLCTDIEGKFCVECDDGYFFCDEFDFAEQIMAQHELDTIEIKSKQNIEEFVKNWNDFYEAEFNESQDKIPEEEREEYHESCLDDILRTDGNFDNLKIDNVLGVYGRKENIIFLFEEVQ